MPNEINIYTVLNFLPGDCFFKSISQAVSLERRYAVAAGENYNGPLNNLGLQSISRKQLREIVSNGLTINHVNTWKTAADVFPDDFPFITLMKKCLGGLRTNKEELTWLKKYISIPYDGDNKFVVFQGEEICIDILGKKLNILFAIFESANSKNTQIIQRGDLNSKNVLMLWHIPGHWQLVTIRLNVGEPLRGILDKDEINLTDLCKLEWSHNYIYNLFEEIEI